MKRFMRGLGPYVVVILLIWVLTSSLGGRVPANTQIEVPYSQFMDMVGEGKIDKVYIVETTLKAAVKDTKVTGFPHSYDYSTIIPSAEVFEADLAALKAANAEIAVTVQYALAEEPSWIWSTLPYILVMVVMLGLFWYMVSQQGQGGNKVMSFGKSKVRMSSDLRHPKTFADVAGADEEKEELQEIVDFLKNPQKFSELGARIPKGVLLVGPPGTGKTLLAKAAAGESGVPFYSISGSDFVEMFVGVGASRVRDLFDTAKKNAPCIVFIDEIDAVGRQRGAGMGGGHDEREQTLNQLLVEMDGFVANEGIIVMAATNRADILDPALLRPGRFDRQIVVNRPDIKGREAILKVHAKGKPFADDVDLKVLAKRTPWFTGADLENVLNEAAILAARRGKKTIAMKEVLEAINRVTIGPEKKSSVVTPKDRQLVAYHETGHALVAHYLKNCDTVHEVSIIPRGSAGGYTMTLPGEETNYVTKGKLTDNIAMYLGGRAAEEIMLGEISTGASSDLKHASSTARSMVVEYGMSDEIGNVYLGGGQEVFLGRDFGHTQNYSESVGAVVDREVKRLLDTAYQTACTIIREHREQMEQVAAALLENEKIDGAEFVAIVGPKPGSEQPKEEAAETAEIDTEA